MLTYQMTIDELRPILLDRVDSERELSTACSRKRDQHYHGARAEAFLDALRIVDTAIRSDKSGVAEAHRKEVEIRDELVTVGGL